jgi:putative transposase
MRRYQIGSHTKTDLKVHLIEIPKYRKRILTGQVAMRERDILRQILLEHELDIITMKISSDHLHMFILYRPSQNISHIVQWLKGISSRILLSEFPLFRKLFLGQTSVGTRPSCCKLGNFHR